MDRSLENKMPKLIRKLSERGRNLARTAYERVETKILVAEGRKAVKRKLATGAKVTKKAAKAAAIAGTIAAGMVVAREIRKRRKLA